MVTHSNKTIANLSRQIEAYGFAGFIEAAKTQLKLMDPHSADHAILSFLLKNAIGAEKAKTWDEINAHLAKLGHRMTKNAFQTNLLKHSRRNLYFIGSNHDGYFLLRDMGDIMAVNGFYDGRIRKEMEHRETLQFLASQLPGEELEDAA